MLFEIHSIKNIIQVMKVNMDFPSVDVTTRLALRMCRNVVYPSLRYVFLSGTGSLTSAIILTCGDLG